MNLKKKWNLSSDYVEEEIVLHGKPMVIFYNEVLTDASKINQFILGRLTKLTSEELKEFPFCLPSIHPIQILEKDILTYVNNGFVVLLFDKKIVAYELKSSLGRGVQNIESELSLYGPKDSFSEVFSTNLGLIRKRIKKDLKVKEYSVGRYSQTKIGVLYVKGIVKNALVKKLEKDIQKINIDGILDSSYLKDFFQKKFHLFPTIMMSERPDKCSMALLEGKVVILVDNSPYALILPTFFFDYFHTTDDYYQKAFHTSFIRLIRVFAFLIAIFTPAVYIAVTTRNYNLVPLPLLLMLKAGRSFVPFPAYLEALFMIICFEILKESDLRMSTKTGSAISILGGLILGDAAVAAGIVSPIMIIIIAISSISGLLFPSIELENALRSYKLFFLFLGTILGIYGVLLGTIIMLFHILSTKSFDYPYLSFHINTLKDSIIRIPTKIKRRNKELSYNEIRGRME